MTIMACVCLEDEWLGEFSKSKYRSCQCCLQFIGTAPLNTSLPAATTAKEPVFPAISSSLSAARLRECQQSDSTIGPLLVSWPVKPRSQGRQQRALLQQHARLFVKDGALHRVACKTNNVALWNSLYFPVHCSLMSSRLSTTTWAIKGWTAPWDFYGPESTGQECSARCGATWTPRISAPAAVVVPPGQEHPPSTQTPPQALDVAPALASTRAPA